MSLTQMDLNNKVMPEAEFRKKMLDWAKVYGCDTEVRIILNKYDKILIQCTNEQERKQIAIMGLAEIHKIMDCYGALVVDGQEIIPASDPNKAKEFEKLYDGLAAPVVKKKKGNRGR